MKGNFEQILKSPNAGKKTRIRFTQSVKNLIKEFSTCEKMPKFEDVKANLHDDSSDVKILKVMKEIRRLRKHRANEIRKINPTAKFSGIQTVIENGFIYLVENELFDGWIKCGMTIDVQSRLKAYNGNDPLKRFKVISSKPVNNRRKAERQLLNDMQMKSTLQNGEWFRVSKDIASQVFEMVS